jgi:hypothetical protein
LDRAESHSTLAWHRQRDEGDGEGIEPAPSDEGDIGGDSGPGFGDDYGNDFLPYNDYDPPWNNGNFNWDNENLNDNEDGGGDLGENTPWKSTHTLALTLIVTAIGLLAFMETIMWLPFVGKAMGVFILGLIAACIAGIGYCAVKMAGYGQMDSAFLLGAVTTLLLAAGLSVIAGGVPATALGVRAMLFAAGLLEIINLLK